MGNGLDYSYVVGSAHLEGTFLKLLTAIRAVQPFCFLFSSDNHKKLATRGH